MEIVFGVYDGIDRKRVMAHAQATADRIGGRVINPLEHRFTRHQHIGNGFFERVLDDENGELPGILFHPYSVMVVVESTRVMKEESRAAL